MFMLPSSGAMQLIAERAEDRARRFLIDRGPGDHRQFHAAIFLRRLRRPQAGGARLDAHRLEPVVRDVLVVGEIGRVFLQRHDMFVDEGAHLEAQRFDFGRECEVHGVFPLSL